MLIALTPNSPNNKNNSVKATKGKPRPEPRPLSQTMTQERRKRHLLRTIILMIYDSVLGWEILPLLPECAIGLSVLNLCLRLGSEQA